MTRASEPVHLRHMANTLPESAGRATRRADALTGLRWLCTHPCRFHGKGIWGVYPDAILPGVHIVRRWLSGKHCVATLTAVHGTIFQLLPAHHCFASHAATPPRHNCCPQVEGGQTSTGSAVAWYRQLVGEADYAALNEEAAAVPPGCEGVVCLDHFQVRGGWRMHPGWLAVQVGLGGGCWLDVWHAGERVLVRAAPSSSPQLHLAPLQGNRTPHTDALSRGAITGLTLKHGRGHVFRSLIESICFGWVWAPLWHRCGLT